MASYLFQRVLQAIPVFIGIVLICFCLLKASGDPVRTLLGPRASQQEQDALRKRLKLDRPWYSQLGSYLMLDLGPSYREDRPVWHKLLEGASVTARLALGAMVIAVALGLTAGLISAARPNSMFDYSAAAGASIGVSIPAFWLAMLLILLFAVYLEWLPLPSPQPGKLEYLIIPVVTLGFVSTALIARLTRSCVLETLQQDYVRTARAKGHTEIETLLGHAFPNALVPVLTVIGNNLASLLTGAVLTETACSLPGLGRIIFEAISTRDHPVIMGGCLLFAFIFVAVNLLVDVLYACLDPRIRHGES